MEKISNLKLNADILNIVAAIDEFKGEWKSLKKMQADILTHLKKVATIESVGSSNRIEGNKLSDSDIEELLSNLKTTKFKNRDEEEVAGYADLSNLIFDDYEIIPFNENYIKQMHSILLKYSSKDERHRGEYKTLPNSVAAFDESGKEIGVIFETATPFDTPRLMKELITWTNDNLNNKTLHPIITIAIFVVNFLAIHPFQDGNGRMSRALTNLLLLKNGYTYVSYSSLEAVIEDNKSAYYLALRQTQTTLKDENPNYDLWINFFVKALEKQKIRLEYKLLHIDDVNTKVNNINITNSKEIKNAMSESETSQNKKASIDLNSLPETAVAILQLFDKTDRININYIKENIDNKECNSESKIKRALILLQQKNIIKKYGTTKGSWYVICISKAQSS